MTRPPASTLEALGLAEKLDLPATVADATTTLAGIDQRSGDPAAAERAVTEVVEQAHRDGDAMGETRGLFLLGGLLHERGDLEAARDAFHRGAEAASGAGRRWAPYGLESRVMEAEVSYELGEWDTCLELTGLDGQTLPPLAAAMLRVTRANVHVGRGDPMAETLLERVRPEWHRDGWVVVSAGAAEIEWYGGRGDLSAMFDAFDRAAALMDVTGYYQARIRLTALLLGRLADAAARAPTAERSRLVERAPELVAAVDKVMQRVERRKRPFGTEGLAWLARAHAEHQRLRWLADVDPPAEEVLVDRWERSVAAFEIRRHVYETARCRARLAAVLRALGRPAESGPLVAAAQQSARRLGAEPLLAELRRGGAPPPRAPVSRYAGPRPP